MKEELITLNNNVNYIINNHNKTYISDFKGLLRDILKADQSNLVWDMIHENTFDVNTTELGVYENDTCYSIQEAFFRWIKNTTGVEM